MTGNLIDQRPVETMSHPKFKREELLPEMLPSSRCGGALPRERRFRGSQPQLTGGMVPLFSSRGRVSWSHTFPTGQTQGGISLVIISKGGERTS
jgi:hypothetical protein